MDVKDKMPHQNELELSPGAFNALLDAVKERLTQYIEGMETHPLDLSHTVESEFLRQMIEPAPEEGAPIESILSVIFEKGAVGSLNPASPGFMGYVPGGGLLHAGIADLIANALNRYVGVVSVAPVFAQIESNVIRWFSEIIGYPAEARGTLTSGGSLASLSAIVTARHVKLGEQFLDGVIYVSDQVHHCVTKAAILAGFPRANVRVIEADKHFRLSTSAVKAAIDEDRQKGLRPFMVVGSAGTTNTGTIDPLYELHTLAQEEGLWFHVDAAYGGFYRMTERGSARLKGLEMADSLVLDPHKTLFLPYGTGALLVRNGNHLRSAHSSSADYMPPMQEDDLVYDFCELSPELTRPFRGLRAWLPIKMHGLSVFRGYLDEKLDLAEWLQSCIAEIPELELIASADLSILAFAVRQNGLSIQERNIRTQALLAAINKKNRVHLTGTTVKGLYVIRVAIGVFRTHKEHIELLLEEVKRAIHAVHEEVV